MNVRPFLNRIAAALGALVVATLIVSVVAWASSTQNRSPSTPLKLRVVITRGLYPAKEQGRSTMTAMCPKGMLALGGGYKLYNGVDDKGKQVGVPNDLFVEVNRPITDPVLVGTIRHPHEVLDMPVGWRITARNPTNLNSIQWNIEVRVICGNAQLAD